MPITAELLELMVCPACRAKLEVKPDQSALKCVSCHRVYAIRNDIAVMMIDQATIEE